MTQMDRMEKGVEGMTEELRTLTKTLTMNVAECKACRRVVMGNGGKPISDRVTTLETARDVSAGTIVKMIMAVGAVSSAIGAIVAIVCS